MRRKQVIELFAAMHGLAVEDVRYTVVEHAGQWNVTIEGEAPASWNASALRAVMWQIEKSKHLACSLLAKRVEARGASRLDRLAVLLTKRK